MVKKLFMFILLIGLGFQTFSQQEKLGNAKESLKSKNTSVTIGKTVVHSTESSTTNTADNFGNPLIRVLWYAAAYTFYGIVFESPWEINGRMSDAEISNYPYKESKYGNFVYTDSLNYNLVRFDVYNRFLVESKNLFSIDIGVDFRFFKRFSMNGNYTIFLEKVKDQIDSFNMFSALLKYHRIRTQHFDAWFGIGVRRIFNDVKETRFLMGLGGEVFIVKPISFVTSHKWATVNDQFVRSTKLLLKYHAKKYRFSAGYENYRLGLSEINAFSFGVEASF